MKLAQERRHSLDEGVLMHTRPWLWYCTILESVVHFHLPYVTRSPLYCCHESRGRCQHGVAWTEKIVLWALCWISLLCGQTVAWVVAFGIAFTLLFNGTSSKWILHRHWLFACLSSLQPFNRRWWIICFSLGLESVRSLFFCILYVVCLALTDLLWHSFMYKESYCTYAVHICLHSMAIECTNWEIWRSLCWSLNIMANLKIG